MTEDEAQRTLAKHVSRETFDLLRTYVDLITSGACSQNLISASSLPSIWNRHILDSAQLADLAPGGGTWLDIGSGAGLPGIVVAIMTDRPVVLVEPRALRARFLEETVAKLGLSDRVRILSTKVERVVLADVAVISARAVAGLSELFAMALPLARPETRWLLPRGRSAAAEVAKARDLWQAEIMLVPSRTDPEASIVVAGNVRPRRG